MKRPAARCASQPARKSERTAAPRGEATPSGMKRPAARGASQPARKSERTPSAASQPAAELPADAGRAGQQPSFQKRVKRALDGVRSSSSGASQRAAQPAATLSANQEEIIAEATESGAAQPVAWGRVLATLMGTK